MKIIIFWIEKALFIHSWSKDRFIKSFYLFNKEEQIDDRHQNKKMNKDNMELLLLKSSKK